MLFWCLLGVVLVSVVAVLVLAWDCSGARLSDGRFAVLLGARSNRVILSTLPILWLVWVVDFPGKPMRWPCCRAI